MSILKNTFENFLLESSNYVELKKNISDMLDSANEMSKAIEGITRTLQAHHIVLGEVLAFQKDLVRVLGVDLNEELDQSKLN